MSPWPDSTSGPISTALHVPSPAHIWPWRSSVHSGCLHSQDPCPTLEKRKLRNKLAKSLAALAPVTTPRKPWSPECSLTPRPKAGSRRSFRCLRTRVNLQRRKETPAPLDLARVSSVGQRPGYLGRGSRAGVRPGSSLRTPASLRACTGLNGLALPRSVP